MHVETDDYKILVEEFRTDHGCTRRNCTDPFGVSRIILDRVIARWPEPPSRPPTSWIERHLQPDFEDLESVTVVGVLTRSGHNLADPEASQRILIAYSGTWRILDPEATQDAPVGDPGMLSKSLLQLTHTIGKGYLSFNPDLGFAPLAWYAGHHLDLNLGSFVKTGRYDWQGVPPLKPVCLNQIENLPAYDPDDTHVQLIVASTSSTNDIRFPARLFFITGLDGGDGITGLIHHGINRVDSETDMAPDAISLWERDFLNYSDGCASITLTDPMSVDAARALISLPIEDAWNALWQRSRPKATRPTRKG